MIIATYQVFAYENFTYYIPVSAIQNAPPCLLGTLAIIAGFIDLFTSIYPSQALATGKSRTIQVQIGTEAEKVKAEVQPRDKSVIGIGLKIIEALKKRVIHVRNSWKSRRDSP